MSKKYKSEKKRIANIRSDRIRQKALKESSEKIAIAITRAEMSEGLCKEISRKLHHLQSEIEYHDNFVRNLLGDFTAFAFDTKRKECGATGNSFRVMARQPLSRNDPSFYMKMIGEWMRVIRADVARDPARMCSFVRMYVGDSVRCEYALSDSVIAQHGIDANGLRQIATQMVAHFNSGER